MSAVSVRRARPADAAVIHGWRRESSEGQESSWDAHLAWISRLIGNPARLLLVVEAGGTPFGVVCFELHGAAEARLHALPESSLRGVRGGAVLTLALREAAHLWGPLHVSFSSSPQDLETRRALEHSGFELVGSRDGRHHEHKLFVHDPSPAPEEVSAEPVAAEVPTRGDSEPDWVARQVAVLSLSGASLLDVGCCRGERLQALCERGVAVDYTGLEASGDAVAAARERFPDARFLKGHLLEAVPGLASEYDFVWSRGLLHFSRNRSLELARAAVSRMFGLARKAAVASLPSAWGPPGPVPGLDPLEVLAFCRALTPWVALSHEHRLDELSVRLYREPPA